MKPLLSPVSDINITHLLEFHKLHKKIGTMSTYNFGQNKGVVEIGMDGIVDAFREKSDFDGDLINIGYMVFEPKIFDYIDGDDSIFERECMDTKREKDKLEELWASGKAPWKIWED